MADHQVTDRKAEINQALDACKDGDFHAGAKVLLGSLGYSSERTLAGQTGGVSDFFDAFQLDVPVTQSEAEFRDEAESAHLIFQITNEEIAAELQQSLFTESGLDKDEEHSFLFVAVELRGDQYPRGKYAQFAREVNRRPHPPTVVLFRSTSGLVTLAFPHRRPSKRNAERDVLGKVSLVREIDPTKPHRAHIDILNELALEKRVEWMERQDRSQDFEGLYAAWLDTLDTEQLNKRFYKDLFRWFERACEVALFPSSGPRVLPSQEHVIRLITRLLFVWFIKEKGLVAEDLFVEHRVGELLKDYDAEDGDSYYRAVLQNLFFATLNTEINQRGFTTGTRDSHRNFSLYRYREEMIDPDALLALFRRTPFINGGLFDCLDSEEGVRDGGWRIDCFTDNPAQRGGLSIPNLLFFDTDDKSPGLIALFNRYKFTVEENTPIEQEVALDPELLGKVFENLLAANTPETKESARKQTGSYYTPRSVVDFMVDEALTASVLERVKPTNGNEADTGWWRDRLEYLLDYDDAFNDASELFTDDERSAVVRAIARTKVLDPAVGSGAFPMSVLHKLTLALRRVDPDNERWQNLQKELALDRVPAAFETRNQREREEELREISDAFERYRNSDFGRKLYLIQNSIFGVDIQPIATQIAKLRFFISLAIEQEPTNEPDQNYGIQPLPNLETRFVAADTLLSLERPLEPTFGDHAVLDLQQQIAQNRERHFHASSRPAKLKFRRQDRALRRHLAKALREADFPADAADQIASWDPYDQNASADWFDPEWMFGITDGFDIVIGNPPYVQLQKDGGRLGDLYEECRFETFARTGDVYQLFQERACRLLRTSNGILAFITSNSWLRAEYGKKTRSYLATRHTPMRWLDLGKDVFDSAIVDSGVLLLRTGGSAAPFPSVDMDAIEDTEIPPAQEHWGETRPDGDMPWIVLSKTEWSVMDKMRSRGTPLKDWDIAINYGIKTGFNEAFIIDNETKDALVAEDPRSAAIIKPVLRGRDIERYRAHWHGLWLIATFPAVGLNIDDYPAVKNYLQSFGRRRLEQSGKRHPDGVRARKQTGNAWFEMQDTCAYHAEFSKEKLFWIDLTERGRFAYDADEVFCVNSAYMLTGNSLKYLCAVLNSALVTWFMQNSALNSGMGTARWVRFTVERIPVPIIDAADQQPFIRAVDEILDGSRPGADSTAWERIVDDLVGKLYGLSQREIQATSA